jgi:hypothetical protein
MDEFSLLNPAPPKLLAPTHPHPTSGAPVFSFFKRKPPVEPEELSPEPSSTGSRRFWRRSGTLRTSRSGASTRRSACWN